MKSRLGIVAMSVGLAAGLTACQSPDQAARQLNDEWNAFVSQLLGGSRVPAPHQAQAQAQPAPVRTLTPSDAAKQAKENAEILQEVYRVVYDRDPADRAMFGSLVDSMNQGASIEGLYNGFTHSSDYRKLEMENPGAKPAALSFFASELARTEAELNPPTSFGPEAAQPLAPPENPGDDTGSANTGVNEVSFGNQPSGAPASASSPAPVSVSTREAEYLKTFSQASIYTLKRVLGDEMLRLVSDKSKDPKALQAWYGAWVVRMCATDVDFGIPLRNKSDAVFHSQWAATADPDRLRWEVLNRIHRILNARNEKG